jgi:hypothetical protein
MQLFLLSRKEPFFFLNILRFLYRVEHSMFLSNLELLLALMLTSVAAQSQPTVTLKPGTVNGAKCPTTNANSFFSIPYAKPPTGDLRFAAPVEFSGSYSGGSLDATSKAPACIQFGSEFVEPGQWAEDW